MLHTVHEGRTKDWRVVMKNIITVALAIVTGWVVALWVHHYTGAWFDPHTDPLALVVWMLVTAFLLYISL